MIRYTPVLLIFFTSCLQAEPFPGSPEVICQWMKAERFSGSSKYAGVKDDLYRCASLRKPISRGEPVDSDVRYVAEGTATTISQVRLEMQMRSVLQPQQTLGKFQEYADILTKTALSIELPEEVRTSIRSEVSGDWQNSGKTIKLEQLHQTARGYDFYFTIL